MMVWLLRYYKEILLAIIIIALVIFAVWVRGLAAKNEALSLEVKRSQAALNQKLVEIDKAVELNKEIVNAISNIKVRSSNYITNVEQSKPPAVGASVVLIGAGLPKLAFAVVSSAH